MSTASNAVCATMNLASQVACAPTTDAARPTMQLEATQRCSSNLVQTRHSSFGDAASILSLSAADAATRIQKAQRATVGRQESTRLRHTRSDIRRISDKVVDGAREVMDLFLEPDIGLSLECTSTHPGASTDGHAGRYVVNGPPRMVAALRRAFGTPSADPLPSGVLSPLSAVTLPDEIKSAVGIPVAATHFAFVYPLEEFRMDRAFGSAINLSEEPWCFALILGGFAYFIEGEDTRAAQLLCVNAITIVPSTSVLHLIGAYKGSHTASLKMMQYRRFAKV